MPAAILPLCLTSLLPCRAADDGAQGGRWELAVDLGAGHSVGEQPIFGGFWQAGLALSRSAQGDSRRSIGVFWDFRAIQDMGPGVSFWYTDLGTRWHLPLTHWLMLRGDAGLSLRHISIAGEIERTVPGFIAAIGVEARLLRLTSWSLGVFVAVRGTAMYAVEPVPRADLEGGLVVTRLW